MHGSAQGRGRSAGRLTDQGALSSLTLFRLESNAVAVCNNLKGCFELSHNFG